MKLLLSEIAAATGGKLVGDDITVTTVSTDSRSVNEGDFFVALVGKNFDGHNFLSQVEKSGAQALLVDRMVDTTLPYCLVENTTLAFGNMASLAREKWAKPLVAITGSCGKTTVKGMLSSILSKAGNTLATAGNFNNEIGVPITLLRLESDHEYAVIEMGANHPGEIDYLSSIAKPDVALVNNVLPSHVEGFGSVDGIAKAKGEIFSNLKAGGLAIVNFDDDYADFWLANLGDQPRYLFSQNNAAADFYASNIEFKKNGCARFKLNTPVGQVAVELGVLGDSNITNAVAASACALAAGASLENIVAGLTEFTAVNGRLMLKAGLGGSVVIDDTYNANPGSVKSAIKVLASYAGAKILVLGDMGELGENAVTWHQEVGAYAKQLGVSSLLTCGILSRFAAQEFGENAQHFESKQMLIDYLMGILKENYTVLVKGSRSTKMEDVVKIIAGGSIN
ncbi:UDP-N-acetylmuramoyl-tripeptide--D-alanyl-D-alanine ligase [Sessilibacter sp. MAH4]